MIIVKKIIIGLVILIAIPLVAALFVDGKFNMQREIDIKQSKEVVFEHLKHLQNQDKWSAWAKMDPDMKKGFEGTDGTVGAIATWDSENSDVGKGEQEIIQITEGERIDLELRFLEPMEATDKAFFITETNEDGTTKVIWGFDSEAPYPFNLMMFFMDMEEMLGPMLEEGLAGLKVIMEAMPAKKELEFTEENVEGYPILYVSESASIVTGEIGQKIGEAYGEIMALIGVANLEMVGMPINITRKFSLEDMVCDFDPALRVAELPEDLELSGRIQKGESYSGKAMKIVHVGDYSNLKGTYDSIMAYIEENGIELNGDSWEEYVDDPTTVSPEEVRTFIYFPVK